MKKKDPICKFCRRPIIDNHEKGIFDRYRIKIRGHVWMWWDHEQWTSFYLCPRCMDRMARYCREKLYEDEEK